MIKKLFDIRKKDLGSKLQANLEANVGNLDNEDWQYIFSEQADILLGNAPETSTQGDSKFFDMFKETITDSWFPYKGSKDLQRLLSIGRFDFRRFADTPEKKEKHSKLVTCIEALEESIKTFVKDIDEMDSIWSEDEEKVTGIVFNIIRTRFKDIIDNLSAAINEVFIDNESALEEWHRVSAPLKKPEWIEQKILEVLDKYCKAALLSEHINAFTPPPSTGSVPSYVVFEFFQPTISKFHLEKEIRKLIDEQQMRVKYDFFAGKLEFIFSSPDNTEIARFDLSHNNGLKDAAEAVRRAYIAFYLVPSPTLSPVQDLSFHTSLADKDNAFCIVYLNSLMRWIDELPLEQSSHTEVQHLSSRITCSYHRSYESTAKPEDTEDNLNTLFFNLLRQIDIDTSKPLTEEDRQKIKAFFIALKQKETEESYESFLNLHLFASDINLGLQEALVEYKRPKFG